MNIKALKDYFKYCAETNRIPNINGLNVYYAEHKKIYKIV